MTHEPSTCMKSSEVIVCWWMEMWNLKLSCFWLFQSKVSSPYKLLQQTKRGLAYSRLQPPHIGKWWRLMSIKRMFINVGIDWAHKHQRLALDVSRCCKSQLRTFEFLCQDKWDVMYMCKKRHYVHRNWGAGNQVHMWKHLQRSIVLSLLSESLSKSIAWTLASVQPHLQSFQLPCFIKSASLWAKHGTDKMTIGVSHFCISARSHTPAHLSLLIVVSCVFIICFLFLHSIFQCLSTAFWALANIMTGSSHCFQNCDWN
jgi:hypothetical protein